MNELITAFLAEVSTKFYIYQLLTIVFLLAYGVLLVSVILAKKLTVMDYIIAFPLALAMYSIVGYFLLSFGIPFNKYTQIVFMVLVLLKFIFINRKKFSENVFDLRELIIYFAIMVISAAILTSGIVKVSVTNDSMYFFSEYPRALVHYGRLNSILDNFLTDASQGIAILGTLPFFFGFDEIFGILLLLSLNFVVFFAYATYDYVREILDEKYARILSGVSVLMLVTSMPFVIMSRWIMANTFFMQYMVIVLYLAYKYAKDNELNNSRSFIILSILITGLSIMRMEGALNVGVLILCIMMLNINSKDVIKYLLLPMLVLQGMYLFRIFKILTLHTGIQFMTEGKALVLIMFLIGIIVFNAFIRDKMSAKLQKYYAPALVLGLLAINIVVLIVDRATYINNLRAFALNTLLDSGWGLFVPVILAVAIMIPKKSLRINYFDYSTVCYVLLTVIAGWARGDALYVSFGDSGNRILIQVVPLLIFAVIIKIAEGVKHWRKEELETME